MATPDNDETRAAPAPHPTGLWQQRVGAYSMIPDLLRQLGTDPQAVLDAVGCPAGVLADPDARISYALCGRLLQACARGSGTPHFGLLAGRAWHLADIGLVGEMVRHSETVREALETLVARQHMNSEGGVAFLWVRGGVAELGYAIYQGGTVGAEQIYDAVLAAGTNFLRELCGPSWSPSEVLVAHAAPPDARHYRSVFRVTPHFDAEYCAIRFREAWMDRAVPGADRERRRRAMERAGAVKPSLMQGVYRTVRLQLLAGGCSGDSVAAALSMHRRTLNRRLQQQGTTFQECLDQVRFEVACQLLSTSRLPLDDVAATLGYASVSPFMRTFRRWSGTTPAQWRRSAGAPLPERLPH